MKVHFYQVVELELVRVVSSLELAENNTVKEGLIRCV